LTVDEVKALARAAYPAIVAHLTGEGALPRKRA